MRAEIYFKPNQFQRVSVKWLHPELWGNVDPLMFFESTEGFLAKNIQGCKGE